MTVALHGHMRPLLRRIIFALPGFLAFLGTASAASGELLTPDQSGVSNPEHGGSNRARFDRELVWFDDVGAYQGADHNRHLGVPEFYEAVGRRDLAAKEQSARRSASILVAAGGTLLVGGALWLIGDVLANVFTASATAGPCVLSEVSGGMACQHHDLVDAAPLITAAAGGVILFAGAVSSPRPLTPENARALAREHNRALLGGASSPPYAGVVGEKVGSLRMAPRLTADGVGMVLAGRF